MSLRHLPRAGFTSKPWKNGLGTTHDIAILPDGADHSGFDLRFALSPITADGVFSAFPGAERVITLITGASLDLEFADGTRHLSPDQSLRFDTGLTPMGRPALGGVEVVNVMANSTTWHIASCEICATQRLALGGGEMAFVFASHAPLSLHLGDESADLSRADAALAAGPGVLEIDATEKTLLAHLKPKTGG